MFEKGHVFTGPDGSGYIATHQLLHGDYLLASDFEAFGGAPKPVIGEQVPSWLERQLWPERFK